MSTARSDAELSAAAVLAGINMSMASIKGTLNKSSSMTDLSSGEHHKSRAGDALHNSAPNPAAFATLKRSLSSHSSSSSSSSSDSTSSCASKDEFDKDCDDEFDEEEEEEEREDEAGGGGQFGGGREEEQRGGGGGGGEEGDGEGGRKGSSAGGECKGSGECKSLSLDMAAVGGGGGLVAVVGLVSRQDYG